MANSGKDIPYHFHAGAQAFSAHFVRPADVPVAAQAATFLPSTGGFAHSRVENFIVSRLAAFKVGESHVAGSWEQYNVVTTAATSTLEGLNVLDFLTAGKIVSRLSARYEEDGNEKKSKRGVNRESHIIALGSHFENLRLGGFEVKVTLRHDLLVKSQNFAELKDNLKNDKKAKVADGVALCSLVEDIEVDPGLKNLPGFKQEGHVLTVPHFGEVALAEIIASPGSVTLTMLRFQLGSPDGGSGSGGQTHTNGLPPPP
ncbi:MAG TPA: hypothetical protein VE077_21395 [Candidatus Methylomirabilis sp.]|nr:hypothetical protein [Candidatus Methylomirabilis sp.]